MDTQPTPGNNEVQFEIDPLGEPVISLGTIRYTGSDDGSRTITDHKVGLLNEAITLIAIGNPGAGGAFTEYVIDIETQHKGRLTSTVKFQDGPLEAGFNGGTNEAYLAILIHRMKGFQSGKFACDENAKTLFHLTQALNQMKLRTLSRQERGVEGTHKT